MQTDCSYFIADLHLCEQQPHITANFIEFCREQAISAQKLYILGDLFEYWLGDDAIDSVAEVVQRELSTLVNNGCEVFYMAGNRDFLLGNQYAQACGMTRLTEPTRVELYGRPALLVHGDAQCTDDVTYQQARKILRDPQWQQAFLAKPIAERIEFANQARLVSQLHTQSSEMAIMDVNQQAIEELFSHHKIDLIIHGHTHRPAVHKNADKTRIVLGDWHHQTHFLKVTPESIKLVNY